jgi:putative transposase
MRRQTDLQFKTWGGRRARAGRKPSGGRRGERHVSRPDVKGAVPLHLTMRVAGVPSLRAELCIAAVRRAFRDGKERSGFRLVQYAVQSDHLHLIVEADNKRLLSNGARGLAIRIARRLNTAIGRRGKVFADRYHSVALTSPRQVRNALAYVLLQARRHAATGRSAATVDFDPCSSAPLFDGFTWAVPRAGPWSDTVVEAASWLLRVGWRRHGRIDSGEIPGK